MEIDYGINDIETLSFREGVRKRVAMYLGSADLSGVYSAIQEIISNSIDEFYMGFGKEITVSLGENNLITVEDNGRGIPFGIKLDGTNVMIDIFSRSHTGGKFNDKAYQSVGGLNGIGAKATCLSSDKFLAQSYRGGKVAKITFEKGLLTGYDEKALDEKEKSRTGTIVQFIPDGEVFNLETIKVEFEVLCERCKNLSYLTKGLKFTLQDCRTFPIIKKEYIAKNGIVQLLTDTVDNPINKKPLYYEITSNGIVMEVAVQWAKNRYEKGYIFTNGLHNSEGGTPVTGIRTAITRTINKDFKTSFAGEAARTGLNYVVNIKIPNPSFANQTKTKINNPELRALADKAFCEGWKEFNLVSPLEVEKIKDFLMKEEKADKAAEKARNAILNSTREIEIAAKKKTYDVEKLKDCINHGSESTLLLCEGKSASGALQTARPIEDVALYALGGKIINAKINSMDKVLENSEVKDIITIIGAGIFERFNNKKMNYGKIGMAVDADADGYNIACLIMVLFDSLMPGLIENGHLYWLKTPFYEISQSGKNYYFETETELKEWEKLNLGKKYTIKRNKGLGSLSDKAKREGIFDNPNSLVRLTMSDVAEAKEQLENLMGENVDFRKEFIFENIDFSKVIG